MDRGTKKPRGATGALSEEDIHLTGGSSATVADPNDIGQQLRRRRAASLRLPPMRCGHRDPLDCRAACNQPGRITGLDGKTYPARWLSPADRDYLAGRVHYLSHHDRLSVRQIRAVLADEHNVRRSVGWVCRILRDWRCTGCSGDTNGTPEHPAGGAA